MTRNDLVQRTRLLDFMEDTRTEMATVREMQAKEGSAEVRGLVDELLGWFQMHLDDAEDQLFDLGTRAPAGVGA